MVDEKRQIDSESDWGHESDSEIVILQDEEGNEHEFTIIDVLELDGKKYAILMPADEEMDEAIVLKIAKDENGEEVLMEIESDEEWESVARAWEQFLDEEE